MSFRPPFLPTIALSFCLGFLAGPATAAPPDLAKLDGSWTVSGRNGQGFSFDFDAQTQVIYWFTSTPTGAPAFFVGVLGDPQSGADGQTVFRTDLAAPVGATFTAPQTRADVRGHLELGPVSCTAGVVRFSFNADTPWCTGTAATTATCSGELPIERLTKQASCAEPVEYPAHRHHSEVHP